MTSTQERTGSAGRRNFGRRFVCRCHRPRQTAGRYGVRQGMPQAALLGPRDASEANVGPDSSRSPYTISSHFLIVRLARTSSRERQPCSAAGVTTARDTLSFPDILPSGEFPRSCTVSERQLDARKLGEKRVLINRLRVVGPGVAAHIRERLPETRLPRERQVDADLGDFVLAVVAADCSPDTATRDQLPQPSLFRWGGPPPPSRFRMPKKRGSCSVG